MEYPVPSQSPNENEQNSDWIIDEDVQPLEDLPISRAKPSSTLVMVETAFMASTASLLWLIDYYFPLGPFLRIIFPLPIALLYLRCGARAAWMSVLVSGLLLTVLMGPPRSIIFVMPYALLGAQMGACWRRGAGWNISIGLGTIISSLGLFFRLWLFSIILGEDLWRYVINQITGLVQWIFLNLGILAEPDVWLIQGVAIFLIVVNSLLYLLTVHLAAYLILERMQQPMPKPPGWIQILIET